MSKFPLPANFFRCPALNVDETSKLLTSADDIAIDIVRYTRLSGGPIKWTLTSDETSVQIYKGDDPDAPAGTVSWLGITEVMATIEEVVDLFRTETTTEYKEYCNMFMKDLLDGQILYTLRRRTPENPHHMVAIKWFALESPIPGLAKPRDWCFLETQQDFELDGKRGWVRAFKSVNLSCCPDLQNSLGLVRGIHHRTGYCFLQSNRPGYLKVAQIIQADIKGNMTDFAISIGMKKRCRLMKSIDTFLRQKRLQRGTFLHINDLVPQESRSKCFVCQRRFGTFSKKGNCRKCGEVVCRRCSQMWNINMSGSVSQLRVCTACSCGTFEAPTDSNTIVDDPNEDQSDSQHFGSPRTHSRTRSANSSSKPLASPYSRNDFILGDNKMQHYASHLSNPMTESPISSLVLLKPMSDLSMTGLPPVRQQTQNLPQPSGTLLLREEDLMRIDTEHSLKQTMNSQSQATPLEVPRLRIWDNDEQQSVLKDDMSNYSESLISFHQPLQRPQPQRPQSASSQRDSSPMSPEYTERPHFHRQTPLTRASSHPHPSSSYDNLPHHSQLYSTPQYAQHQHQAYGHPQVRSQHRQNSTNQQNHRQTSRNYGYIQHEHELSARSQGRQQHNDPYFQPRHQQRLDPYSQPSQQLQHYTDPYLQLQHQQIDPYSQQPQQHQYIDPYTQPPHRQPRPIDPNTQPSHHQNHRNQHSTRRPPHRAPQQQFSYLQQQHNFLQDGDNSSSSYSNSQVSALRDDIGPPPPPKSSAYSNLYTLESNEPSLRRNNQIPDRTDLVLSLPPTQASSGNSSTLVLHAPSRRGHQQM